MKLRERSSELLLIVLAAAVQKASDGDLLHWKLRPYEIEAIGLSNMDIIGLQAGPTEGGLQVVSWPQPRSNKGGRPFSGTRTELSNRRDLFTDKKHNFKYELIHHN